MKKTVTYLCLMALCLCIRAQVRTSLYEEFTGENYGNWFTTNPTLNTLLSSNSTLVIPIKWQVPIPSAPGSAWSLYQTNKAEINWRCKSSSGSTVATAPSTLAYGYSSQNTPTDVVTNGINSGSTGRIDGQHQWAFGANSDDPADLNNTVIASAQTQTTNFSINMATNWSPTFTNCIVSVTVTSSTSFASISRLMFPLCLVERIINFTTSPGINGEKHFYDAVRQSYPTGIVSGSVTSIGTQLPTFWTAGQAQTFTVNCNIPNYIHDPSQMAFVGFIQDDGDRKVYQAARTIEAAIPNDINNASVIVPTSCTGTFAPSFVAQNLGTVAVTALTVTPYVDGIVKPIFNYTGSIAAGTSATITIPLPNYTASNGSHTLSTVVTGVSGGDINTINNSNKTVFGISNIFTPGVAEPFATFPPANWYVQNYDFEPGTWGLGNAGGFGGSTTSAKYDFWNGIGGLGSFDDLVFPALNLTGITSPTLSFDVAYAQYTNQNDKLDVMASIDCGANWTTVYSKQGAILATAPSNSINAFTPNATQWRNEIVNLASIANQPSVLLKFVATTDFGNNLYVDNVNIGTPVITTINKINAGIISATLFPNPTVGLTNLSIHLLQNEAVGITVINSIGEIAYFSEDNNFKTGINTIILNTENWASGIYFINISTPNGIANTKLMVTK